MRLTLFNMYLCQLFLRFRVKLGLDPDICFQSGLPATTVCCSKSAYRSGLGTVCTH